MSSSIWECAAIGSGARSTDSAKQYLTTQLGACSGARSTDSEEQHLTTQLGACRVLHWQWGAIPHHRAGSMQGAPLTVRSNTSLHSWERAAVLHVLTAPRACAKLGLVELPLTRSRCFLMVHATLLVLHKWANLLIDHTSNVNQTQFVFSWFCKVSTVVKMVNAVKVYKKTAPNGTAARTWV